MVIFPSLWGRSVWYSLCSDPSVTPQLPHDGVIDGYLLLPTDFQMMEYIVSYGSPMNPERVWPDTPPIRVFEIVYQSVQ